MDLSKQKGFTDDPSGNLFKYDLSLPVREWECFLNEVALATAELGFLLENRPASEIGVARPRLKFCCFGHMGDDNLHLNIILR
jgi:hypothetical protein